MIALSLIISRICILTTTFFNINRCGIHLLLEFIRADSAHRFDKALAIYAFFHIDIQQAADDFRHLQRRSEEHTSELQSLMRISYAVFCLKKKITQYTNNKREN